MKKGVILTVLLSAVAGAIAAFVVVKTAGPETVGQQVVISDNGGQFRTVNLTQTEYPVKEDVQKKNYDVVSTSSSVKPEDAPRLAEAFASGTYIPGVTENPGATSLDSDGKSLLRQYSCRYGDIELQPYIRNCNYNDIVFEIVKWYPNTYYGKHNEYNIVGDTAYNKANPNVSIPVSLLDREECNYVISFVHLTKGKMVEPVSTRPGELKGEDLQNYNRLKKIAKYIVGNIIDKENSANENNFVIKKEE